MFNQQAVDKSGNAVNIQDYDLVCLYFSAHWCPPCRAFTPKLAETYNTWKQQGESIEIIFVSSDQDEGSQMEYYAGMPWARVPFNEQAISALKQQFSLSGIPYLVILDRGCNQIISTNGWGEVRNQGPAAINNWKPVSKQPVAAEIQPGVDTKNSESNLFNSESGKISGFNNQWSDVLIELQDDKPVKFSCQVGTSSDNAEFMFGFSKTKAQWGNDDRDALTWYGSVQGTNFHFRKQMFEHIDCSYSLQPPKCLGKDTWHLFEVELSKNHARYSVNGEVFASLDQNGGNWPTSGYFGFVGYSSDWEWRNVKFSSA